MELWGKREIVTIYIEWLCIYISWRLNDVHSSQRCADETILAGNYAPLLVNIQYKKRQAEKTHETKISFHSSVQQRRGIRWEKAKRRSNKNKKFCIQCFLNLVSLYLVVYSVFGPHSSSLTISLCVLSHLILAEFSPCQNIYHHFS